MDEVKTAAFTLGPDHPQATAAVLLIHGFTGSPWEVRPLGEALAARGFHVRAIRLPGHGQGPGAMAWVTHRDWQQAASEGLEALGGFRQVFVAGHSMGALLGMLLAAKNPARVDALALLAPAWGLRQPGARLLQALRWVPLGRWTGLWVNKRNIDLEDADARADAPMLPRYPLARLYDLFALQDQARVVLSRVRCPVLVAGAVQDHVVPLKAVEQLAARLPQGRLLVLRYGFHILPRDKDRAVLADAVARFFGGLAAPDRPR